VFKPKSVEFGQTLLRRKNPLTTRKQGGIDMHKFKVGQSVQFNGGAVRRSGVSGTFKIVKLLPSEGDDQQYCIKSPNEPHERIAKESQLNHVL
jgi:hypothetical protein